MPVTNGCSPEAPGGGHKSHAGAVFEAPAAAGPDDLPEPAEPPEAAEPNEFAPAAPRAVEARATELVPPLLTADALPIAVRPVPLPEPPDSAPEAAVPEIAPVAAVDAAVAVAAAVAVVDCPAADGVAVPVVPAPSVTTPLPPTLPVVIPLVCAATGAAAANDNRTA